MGAALVSVPVSQPVTSIQGVVAKFLELFLGYQSGPLQANKENEIEKRFGMHHI